MKSRRMLLAVWAVSLLLLALLAAPASAQEPDGEPAPTLVPEVTDVAPEPQPHIESPDLPQSPDAAPSIDVWYGTKQQFGQNGIPQRWVNIVGQVSNPSGVSLSYNINGGDWRPLNMGPTIYRLVEDGDFNADPAFSDFDSGKNTVTIRAKYGGGEVTKQVEVEIDKSKVWQNPYYLDWSKANDIQDVAQVVDGLWEIKDGKLHIVRTGYDRFIDIGDTTWVDYDVVVPITIHQMSLDGKPGVGILVRWNGHGEDGSQPHYEHPLGALGWYRYLGISTGYMLELKGNGDNIRAKTYSLNMGETYNFKMRAQKRGGNTDYYLKVWPADAKEPSGWSLSGSGLNVNPAESHGSIGLIAHRSDVTFGNVTITPIQDGYTLDIASNGQGGVKRTPEGPYSYGEVVTLEPEPASGWKFVGWDGEDTGDLVKKGDNTWELSMVKNRSLKATYESVEFTLSIYSVPVGKGYVTLAPSKPVYQYGDVVTVTAAGAVPGWGFVEWSGDLTGTGNPAMVEMTATKVITATFAEIRYNVYVPLVTR